MKAPSMLCRLAPFPTIGSCLILGACATSSPHHAEERVPAADPSTFVCAQAAEYFTGVRFPSVNEKANGLAKTLERHGLDRHAYMVKWKAPNVEAKIGPFNREGNTLVVGLESNQARAWMERVGKKTIGLMVTDIPENNPGTAGLRLGDEIWTYHGIRDGGSPESATQLLSNGGQYTETTFEVTPAQLAELKRFVRTRARHGIISDGTVRGYPEGTPITPEFDSSSFTMRNESCAAACTSPFDYRWLTHYDHGDVLKTVTASLMIAPTYVAKRNIWGNFRNPYASAITIFGINSSNRRLSEDFMRFNSWGYLRGLPQWGVMPDSADGSSGATTTIRHKLADWNRSH
jgi:hypothetical protein